MAQNNAPGTHVVTDNAISSRVFLGNTAPSYPVAGDFWMDNTGGSAPNQNFFSYTATAAQSTTYQRDQLSSPPSKRTVISMPPRNSMP